MRASGVMEALSHEKSECSFFFSLLHSLMKTFYVFGVKCVKKILPQNPQLPGCLGTQIYALFLTQISYVKLKRPNRTHKDSSIKTI